MIGKLRGRIDEINDDGVVIDVGGVGYQLFCSTRTMAALAPGEAAIFTVETHVREDHIHLYGFSDSSERDWFRLLSTVQGVGSKTALAILGAYAPPQIANAILAKDAAAFKAVSGIGPKLAERIVTELKDKTIKVSGFKIQDSENKKSSISGAGIKKPESSAEDAISALTNLGYTRSEAYSAVTKAAEKGAGGLDELIKLSLKELARK